MMQQQQQQQQQQGFGAIACPSEQQESDMHIDVVVSPWTPSPSSAFHHGFRPIRRGRSGSTSCSSLESLDREREPCEETPASAGSSVVTAPYPMLSLSSSLDYSPDLGHHQHHQHHQQAMESNTRPHSETYRYPLSYESGREADRPTASSTSSGGAHPPADAALPNILSSRLRMRPSDPTFFLFVEPSHASMRYTRGIPSSSSSSFTPPLHPRTTDHTNTMLIEPSPESFSSFLFPYGMMMDDDNNSSMLLVEEHRHRLPEGELDMAPIHNISATLERQQQRQHQTSCHGPLVPEKLLIPQL